MTEAPVLPILLMGVANFLQFYLIILLIRVLLSWFPNINWYNPPFSIISQLTDPYLNLFRGLIPPIGGLDFSPIIAFFLLQFLVQLLSGFSSSATLF
ncbi:YggT family protein [uncultured Thermosynechococcus sp.]|uniref:YggT family protein n=1 Tax=uncultured Thermosynechococcus sp. TaxID=436945 RepID=UPI00261A8A25|nr:YggT family protein [uncultured Thermosynechococcus sp.]